MRKVKVGLIGLGAIGRLHFDCWRRSAFADLVAISSRNPRLLAGDWGGQEFNLGAQAAQRADLSGLASYANAEKLIADPSIDAVDLCVPTPLHAPLAVAALRAGKHVFCEKPMALRLEDCALMERTAREFGRQLMVGHCLRYWPQYVKAHALLQSGELGRVHAAEFHRSSPEPSWGGSGWYRRGAESGGVLDLHIHDIDVALWWFGPPQSITATGTHDGDLPLRIDADWRYPNGLKVALHGSWHREQTPFRHAFLVEAEMGTLVHDLARHPEKLFLTRDGNETAVPVEAHSAYQAELDDFAQAIQSGQTSLRCTPEDSRRSVAVALEEWRRVRD